MKAQSPNTLSAQFLKTDGGKTRSNAIEVPSLSLPKGGGAIKGIDETFTVNAVNGTAAFAVPLPFSSARGASPALSLSYNSGTGNGIFGLGWDLGLPAIKRKTDKGLPQYHDAADSDIYLFSEAEDLVPEFKKEADGSFAAGADGGYQLHENDTPDGLYTISYFKPRLEGLFARMERWTEKTSGRIRWRIITRDNLTTLFGWSSDATIADPRHANRIYAWLPEFSFDDKGNCTRYVYKKEDAAGLDRTLLHNRNRIAPAGITYTNRYLEKILYGNISPYKKFGDPFPPEADFMFQTVFDFGEYDPNPPFLKVKDWDYRPDAFSDYKPGFEIRTTRLCKRVLLFHHFPELPGGSALVKSTDFDYDTSSGLSFTFLKSLTTSGYIKKADGGYTQKRLPALELAYQQPEWNKEVKSISAGDVVHAPAGLDEPHYQFTDLFNEGLSGILSEQATGWYYKHNLGDGKFGEATLVSPKPSFSGLGEKMQLVDLDADGGKQLVSYDREPKGYFELNEENEWQEFRAFHALPDIDFGDKNTRMLDLDGDGKPEVLITEDNIFTWYRSAGRSGFSQVHQHAKPFEEEAGPAIVFADASQTIFLADMSGDGLTDIVRIRNGGVAYWPNLGYGNFGAKVALDQAPWFDHPEAFNPAYIKLADIDGSGTTDIIYLGQDKFSCWFNLSGNAFNPIPFEIAAFPEVDNQANITVTDLLGNGVACIVWSGSLAKDAGHPLRYIDLMNSRKPHVLVSYKNNLGKEVSLEYTPSTRFYMDDKLAGKPWATKLHFPVHCLSRTETRDKISGCRFVSSYSYHHGYYDHPEREFRGFGLVEQTDAEHFENWVTGEAANIVEQELHQEPVVSRTWFHTGAFLGRARILSQFANEYWYEEMGRQGFTPLHPEVSLPDARIIAAPGIPQSFLDQLSAGEWREAFRACKNMALRREIFAHDAPAAGASAEEIQRQLTPYSVATHNCVIELVQPKGQNRFAVFVVKESEAITYNYERNTQDPRIAHHLNTRLDAYGNVLEAASVVYPRVQADAALPAETQQEQSKTVITCSQHQFTNDVLGDEAYRLRLPSEVKTFELKGLAKTGPFYTVEDFETVLATATEVAYADTETDPAAGMPQKRLIEHIRTHYYRNDLGGPLPLHQQESLSLPFESYQLAYTPELIADIYGTKVDAALLAEGNFSPVEADNNWWIRSGSIQFIAGAETAADARNRFYVPLSYTDPYGAKTKVKYYGTSFLFIEETEDALGNKAKVDLFNFRTLAPQRMRDLNNNLSEALSDELGLVKAMAVLGKGNEADDLAGLTASTEAAEDTLITQFFQVPDTPEGVADSTALMEKANQLLQHATARYVYDFGAYKNTGKPAVVAAIVREEHFQKNNASPIQLSYEYANGMGKVAMKKVQAEPGRAKKVTVNAGNTYAVTETDTASLSPRQLRWIGNGRTILNNKGQAVKQYEPYFSVTHRYEDLQELVETGVSPLLFYDAPGRLIKTEMPDGTLSRTTFDAWKQVMLDANDTVLESAWYHNRTNRLIDAALTAAGKDPAREKAAADKTASHANTPQVLHFDTLGRPVLLVAHNKQLGTGADEFHRTKVKRDAEGNLRSVTDARELPENLNKGNTVMRYKYDMLGHMVYQHSMDAGQRWLLLNVLGAPLRTWDERSHEFQYFYDALHRPSHSKIKGGQEAVLLDHVFDRIQYGESHLLPDRSNAADLQALNALGKPINHFDTGGLVLTPQYDFKGQPTRTTRKLFRHYKSVADWTEENLENDLENESFTFITETDALGRITRQTAPDGSIRTPSYNEAGLLNGESVAHADPALAITYIKDIDYNEKGQRNKVIYGNDVITRFYYDQETFRLNRLETKRQNNDPLQDCHYTFDPVGNITHLEDKCVPLVFFDNQKVTGLSAYTYDALYRLVEATGRENNASLAFGTCDNWNDKSFMHLMNPGDAMALRNYTQQYQYDAAGNIVLMKHGAPGGNWTRTYAYETASNRLQSTRIGDNGNPANYTRYQHHPGHGFLEELPHLEKISWNFKEELVLTSRQHCTADNIPLITYYQYDGQGQRIRKITENGALPGATPTKKDERIYLAGYETYRTYQANTLSFERESLSLIDQGHRFVLAEKVKMNAAPAPAPSEQVGARLIRYQLHNHLGSAALELDMTAQVISYEEYHPFGTTAYQAHHAAIKAAAKRYRYTGMERDEETGLEYHSARYYLPWLGRWLSADPAGLVDGVNLYRYGRNNPVLFNDLNGMDPPSGTRDPLRVTPLVTDISPTGVSGSVQLHNVLSRDRAVSGRLSLSGGLRSSFILEAPPLSLHTTGFFTGSGTATVDTNAGTGHLQLRGGGVLGDLTGLHVTALGTASLQIPVPATIPLGQAGQTFASALPGASGEVSAHGALQYGSFSLARFRASATLDAGQFSGTLDATTTGDIGRFHVEASGSIGSDGRPALHSASATAHVGVPGVELDARATGSANPDGSLSVAASARLRLFGLPSLQAQGTGSVSSTGASLQGTFSGPGPLYTSFITGDFSLSTSTGVSGSALVAGLTYSPSLTLRDPAPPSPGLTAVAGSARTPWEPGGLTLGASFFRYSHGNLDYISAGIQPDLSANIFTNIRFGVTAQLSF